MEQSVFLRSEMLLGSQAMQRLANAKVAVFGLGGVGSYVVEALVRGGIGRLVLIDSDVVAPSNLNRQLIATQHTIGTPKIEAERSRTLSINPDIQLETHQLFLLPEQPLDFLHGCDYVVDAIDTISAKLYLVQWCHEHRIPLISSMGTGNKLDPTRFEVADIMQTSVCPLCRVMRRELKARGLERLKVVYSKEPPRTPGVCEAEDSTKRQTPGSVSFVPGVAGLILAGEVIKQLAGVE